MTEEPIPTTDHEWTAMVGLLALVVAWPFFHPFHSTTTTVIYWAGVAVVAACTGSLIVGAVLRFRSNRASG